MKKSLLAIAAIALLVACASTGTMQKVGYLDADGQVKVKEVFVPAPRTVRAPPAPAESLCGSMCRR